jgi:hypothetical protein
MFHLPALLLAHCHTTWFGTGRHLQSRRGDRGWCVFCRYEASPLVTEHHCVHRSDCGSSWSADSRTSARRWQVSATAQRASLPKYPSMQHRMEPREALSACARTRICLFPYPHMRPRVHPRIHPALHPPTYFFRTHIDTPLRVAHNWQGCYSTLPPSLPPSLPPTSPIHPPTAQTHLLAQFSHARNRHAPLCCSPPCYRRCATDWDCSLGGECISGACVCDPWFTGVTCALLNLQAPEDNEGGTCGPGFESYYSWGGRAAGKTADGTYHIYAR